MENHFKEYNFFKTTKEIKLQAKEAIKGNKKNSLWLNFIFWLIKLCFFAGLTLLVFAFINFYSPIFLILLGLAIGFLIIAMFFYGPLRISVCKNALNMINNTNPSFKDISFGFNNYFKSMGFGIGLFFRYLFNLILLIIPFGFKYINSQFSPYILAENKDVKINEAFKLSKLYMRGYKISYVKLLFSFSLNFLLSIITIYVYSLFARPKFNTCVGCLYLDLKE